MSLVELLQEEQAMMGKSDTEFAEFLGISLPAWSLARSGKRGIGLENLSRIVKRFPSARRRELLGAAGLNVDAEAEVA